MSKIEGTMIRRFFAFSLLLLVVAGCATAPRPGGEASTEDDRLARSTLRTAIAVGDVTGDRTTNPDWHSDVTADAFKEVLQTALSENDLHAPNGEDYRLNAVLVNVHEPVIGGLTMEVSTSVTYVLAEALTGDEIFEETIVSSFTAGVDESLLGFERLAIAKEGSLSANLEKLIEFLMEEADTNPALGGDDDDPDVS